jgi:RimJ/RimL family protein N-acetyltransferase
MWNFFQGGVSESEAYDALAYMAANHARNTTGSFYHLCLAVCQKEKPQTIWGWCGLDGKENSERPEIYVLLHERIRNRGWGTQCVKALLSYAFGDAGLSMVHGGCDQQNIASAKMMQKGGMSHYADAENGDPLFIAVADKGSLV